MGEGRNIDDDSNIEQVQGRRVEELDNQGLFTLSEETEDKIKDEINDENNNQDDPTDCTDMRELFQAMVTEQEEEIIE